MKRFVLLELLPSYVLLAVGALIYLLESSRSTVGQLIALVLFAAGTWIVFRPRKFTASAKAALRALAGAVRSKGSR